MTSEPGVTPSSPTDSAAGGNTREQKVALRSGPPLGAVKTLVTVPACHVRRQLVDQARAAVQPSLVILRRALTPQPRSPDAEAGRAEIPAGRTPLRMGAGNRPECHGDGKTAMLPEDDEASITAVTGERHEHRWQRNRQWQAAG
jgi:hypothetical protein